MDFVWSPIEEEVLAEVVLLCSYNAQFTGVIYAILQVGVIYAILQVHHFTALSHVPAPA